MACSTTPSWQGRPAARLPLHPSQHWRVTGYRTPPRQRNVQPFRHWSGWSLQAPSRHPPMVIGCADQPRPRRVPPVDPTPWFRPWRRPKGVPALRTPDQRFTAGPLPNVRRLGAANLPRLNPGQGVPRMGILESNSCSQTVYPTVTLLAMKDSGLRIRVERELREKFLALCREQDKPAAQVIREFMRDFIASHDVERPLRTKASGRKNG